MSAIDCILFAISWCVLLRMVTGMWIVVDFFWDLVTR